LMWTESDEQENEGQRRVAEPCCDLATAVTENTDDDAIVVDILRRRQQPKLVEEERMLQEKYGIMKDLEESVQHTVQYGHGQPPCRSCRIGRWIWRTSIDGNDGTKYYGYLVGVMS
jgi:hypothetical protein